MTPDDPVPPPAEAAPAAAPLPPAYEGMLVQLAREVLRDRRSERRWRGTACGWEGGPDGRQDIAHSLLVR